MITLLTVWLGVWLLFTAVWLCEWYFSSAVSLVWSVFEALVPLAGAVVWTGLFSHRRCSVDHVCVLAALSEVSFPKDAELMDAPSAAGRLKFVYSALVFSSLRLIVVPKQMSRKPLPPTCVTLFLLAVGLTKYCDAILRLVTQIKALRGAFGFGWGGWWWLQMGRVEKGNNYCLDQTLLVQRWPRQWDPVAPLPPPPTSLLLRQDICPPCWAALTCTGAEGRGLFPLGWVMSNASVTVVCRLIWVKGVAGDSVETVSMQRAPWSSGAL